MNNETQHPDNSIKPGNGTLVLYMLCTVIALTVIALSTMMMALGSGLGSSPDDPIPRVSTILWSISGLSFLPCTILLILLVGTHRRTIAVTLAVAIIAAGMLTAIGWFINSGGEMPGTSAGDAIVVAVIGVPIIAGTIMIWRSSMLKS